MTEGIRQPGVFVTFEGGEGVGKSTHIRFLAEVLEEQGYEVVSLREPGGTKIGETLRLLVLDPEYVAMTAEAELLIYEAARAQLIAEVIVPALARGAVVLCDRFYDSTIAYQAFGRGLSRSFVERANEFVCDGTHPDRTVLLLCGDDVKVGLDRASHHCGTDRIEQAGKDFHERVAEGFLKIAAERPERVRIVESLRTKPETAAAIFDCLSDLFPWMKDERIVNGDLFARLEQRYYGNKKTKSKLPYQGLEFQDSGFRGLQPASEE